MIKTRLGVNSRAILFPGAAPTAGFVWPLSDAAAFGSNSDFSEVPNYNGTRLPYGVVPNAIMADGSMPTNFEYTFIGHLLKMVFGAEGYTRNGNFHNFFIPVVAYDLPIAQLQYESMESPVQYQRHLDVHCGGVDMSYGTSGAAVYNANLMGTGEELQTALGGPPTITDYGFSASNYFNGEALAEGVPFAGMNAFSLGVTNNLAREDVAFTGGIAGAITSSQVNVTGNLGILLQAGGDGIEEDLTMYSRALAQTNVPLECSWWNKPSGFFTKFCRVRLAGVLLSRESWRPGGGQSLRLNANWRSHGDPDANKLSGEIISTNVGPFTLPATPNLGVKIDGGGTITIALVAGAQTAQEIVDDLNADVTFTAGAVARVYGERILIYSKTKGATSSIQIDTGVANTAHAEIGFTGVAVTGKDNCPIMITLFNEKSTDY